MDTTVLIFIFGIFVLLAAFNAGTMTTLQLQHYGIYRFVGRANFIEYIRANNRAALLPTIVPAILLLFASGILTIIRPPFMSLGDASAALSLNLAQLASTFVWQRRLQAEMAETGYDEAKIRLLLSTNWIRTIAFLIQVLLAAVILVRALERTG
jgi:hypothetical protein